MSHASLKEQLQIIASQITEKPPVKSPNIKNPAPSQRSPKKPKPRWLEYVQYGVELLRLYFPLCFKSPKEIVPLKKGIKQDLIQRISTIEAIATEDKACMVKSLAYYVNTAAYLRCVIENTMRINLDGQESGKVTAEEAKYSAERYQTKLKLKQAAASKNPEPLKENRHDK